MLLKCIVGSIGHFLFFTLLLLFASIGYLAYLITFLFVKDAKAIFKEISSYAYKIFFIFAPRMVLKKDLIDNLPNGAIYISTHQSILDFPALGTFVKNFDFFANINLGKVPVLAEICDFAGIKYIAGKELDDVSKIYHEFETSLKDGKNIIFFPEGTRHVGDKLKPFKRGAFRLSRKTSAPIVPVVISGASTLLPRKAFCIGTLKKTDINVKVLDILYPKDFKNDREMMQFAQKIMQEEKNKLIKK